MIIHCYQTFAICIKDLSFNNRKEEKIKTYKKNPLLKFKTLKRQAPIIMRRMIMDAGNKS